MTPVEDDTETLLALVSSLLERSLPNQAEILAALADCNGDVEKAAASLNNKYSREKGKESQKRKAGLHGWLKDLDSVSNKSARPIKRARSPSPSEQISPTHVSSSNANGGSKSASTSSSSAAKVKAITNKEFISMFRPPSSSEGPSRPCPAKHPPLTLATPELVAKHTPCTLHTSILPQELACRLFYVMLHESRSWERNKWYLFDRMVESPHRTSFFIRKNTSGMGKGSDPHDVEMDEAAQFWYNGRKTGPSPPFPKEMEEACEYIERVVNEEMRKRPRFALEWGGEPGGISHEDDGTGHIDIIWRANVAASNCYEGTQESVGFHSDALTYLGPYATIASLSLGTNRVFRLREVVPTDEKESRSARTFNIPLPHNSLTIMHASCQEMFKHSIPPQRTIDLFHPPHPPPLDLTDSLLNMMSGTGRKDKVLEWASNCRINITFRFFRPDFRPSATPKCRCGIPCLLRPDMKNRYPSSDPNTGTDVGSTTRKYSIAKYWWTCNAGAQNQGKGCGLWQVMDAKAEGRGPFAGNLFESIL